MRIVVLVKPVPDPASGGERLGPGRRGSTGPRRPAVVNGNDEYALEAALKLTEAARRRGHPRCRWRRPTAPETMRKALAMGATSGVLVTDAGARRLRHRLDGPGPRGGRSQDARVRPRPRRRRHLRRRRRRRAGRASRRCSACRTSRTPRRSSPTRPPARVRVHRISPTGYDVLEAPMPALDRRAPRRSASRATRRSRGSWPPGRRTIATRSLADLGARPATVGGAVATTRRRRRRGAAAARRDAGRPRAGRRGRPRGRRLPRRAEDHLMAGAIWVHRRDRARRQPGQDQHGGRDARPDARRGGRPGRRRASSSAADPAAAAAELAGYVPRVLAVTEPATARPRGRARSSAQRLAALDRARRAAVALRRRRARGPRRRRRRCRR